MEMKRKIAGDKIIFLFEYLRDGVCYYRIKKKKLKKNEIRSTRRGFRVVKSEDNYISLIQTTWA